MKKYYLWIIAGIIISLVTASLIWGESLRVLGANQTYTKGEFSKARAVYEDLLVKKNKSPYLLHNQGLALYREAQPQPATACFEKALTNQKLPQNLLARLYYHLGSTQFATADKTKDQKPSQLFQNALQSFKKAILAERTDLDAKYNYELTLLRVKAAQEAEQKQEQQKKQNQNQADQQKEEQEQDQKEQNQDQKNQDQNKDQTEPNSSASPKPTPGKEEQQKAKEAQASSSPKTGMSQAEAEALLKMVENGEQYQGPKINAESGLGTKDW